MVLLKPAEGKRIKSSGPDLLESAAPEKLRSMAILQGDRKMGRLFMTPSKSLNIVTFSVESKPAQGQH